MSPPAHVRGWLVAATLVASVLLASSVAQAQSAAAPLPPVRPPTVAAPPAPATPSEPPYEGQLDRLAELLGTLSYLRDLCGDGDGTTWRDKMTALLEAEARTGNRKERLAGSYNRGFRGYQLTYRACTPSAQVVIARALDEGQAISRDLAVRFGGE